MNLKIVVLMSCALFSSHAFSFEMGQKKFNDKHAAILTDPQKDLNCKMYALAGAMFAERRDNAVSKEQANKAVMENFQNAGTPTKIEKVAMKFVMSSLYQVGEDAYENSDLSDDTILQSFPYLCLANYLHPVNAEQKRDFFTAMLTCQTDNPLDLFVSPKNEKHPQVVQLRTCFKEASYIFMLEVLGLNGK